MYAAFYQGIYYTSINFYKQCNRELQREIGNLKHHYAMQRSLQRSASTRRRGKLEIWN